jgi:serine/threonine-protein kinase HipA
LEYIPDINSFKSEELLELKNIQAIIDELYEEKELEKLHFLTEKDKQMTLDYMLTFGASIGGIRPKIFVGLDAKKKSLFPVDAARNDGIDFYLMKISGNSEKFKVNADYGKIEYAYYLMAKECGIEMSDSLLIDKKHFATKRFDRIGVKEKIHYQTFNSFFGKNFRDETHYSYEYFFDEMIRMKMTQSDLVEFYRRVCFNIIGVNCDDHTKNFSMILIDNKWKLAPAYDLVYCFKPIGNTREHSLSLNFKTKDFDKADLELIGKKYLIKNYKKIIENTIEVFSNVSKNLTKLKVEKELVKIMEEKIKSASFYS